MWAAAERLPEFDALVPGAKRAPPIAAPAEVLKPWTREGALTEILRRLPGLRVVGPPLWRGFVPLHELEHLPVAWTCPG